MSFAKKDADLGMDTIWERALEKLRMEIHCLLFLEHLIGLRKISEATKFQKLESTVEEDEGM